MTQAKHTQGPWQCFFWDAGCAEIEGSYSAKHSPYIVKHKREVSLLTEHDANARLIAAAPIMLDALTNERNGCIETIEYCQRWLKTLREGLHNSGNSAAVDSVDVVINNLKNLDANTRAAIAKATGGAA